MDPSIDALSDADVSEPVRSGTVDKTGETLQQKREEESVGGGIVGT